MEGRERRAHGLCSAAARAARNYISPQRPSVGPWRGLPWGLREFTSPDPRGERRARDPGSASHRPLVEKKEGEARSAEAEDEDRVARPRGPADLFKTGELVEGVAVVVEP